MTYNLAETPLIVYGNSWCGDCARARRILDRRAIPYQWVDIQRDTDGAAYVEEVNDGNRSVPTILFPDGSLLVEPPNHILEQKLDEYLPAAG